MSGTSIFTSFAAWITPWATQSQRLMPAKMFTRIALTLRSERTRRKAVATRSGLAPPPTSRKLAGSPPACLIMSMVRHGEAGAVDDAADFALEADIAEVVLGGLGLTRIALRGIVHVGDVAATEHGVVVEGHLGVERQDAVVLGDDERVDLQHGAVAIAERPVGVHDRLHGRRDLLDVQAELERDLAGLELLQTDGRLDHDLDQGFGLVGGDLFDIHAAALRGDDADALGLTVEGRNRDKVRARMDRRSRYRRAEPAYPRGRSGASRGACRGGPWRHRGPRCRSGTA